MNNCLKKSTEPNLFKFISKEIYSFLHLKTEDKFDNEDASELHHISPYIFININNCGIDLEHCKVTSVKNNISIIIVVVILKVDPISARWEYCFIPLVYEGKVRMEC